MKKIIRFSAVWCQTCKMLAANLEKVETDVQVEVVDIDKDTNLAVEFGIRSVPTLVLMDGDKEIARCMGVKTVDQLKEWIESN